jgi:hypothetical protein
MKPVAIDKVTGLPIDPYTGLLIDTEYSLLLDPKTGNYYDPQTGLVRPQGREGRGETASGEALHERGCARGAVLTPRTCRALQLVPTDPATGKPIVKSSNPFVIPGAANVTAEEVRHVPRAATARLAVPAPTRPRHQTRAAFIYASTHVLPGCCRCAPHFCP